MLPEAPIAIARNAIDSAIRFMNPYLLRVARRPNDDCPRIGAPGDDIAMTMQVRRVVTGHDENGNAVVVSDEGLATVSRGVGTGISGCEMWSTNRMPIDNSAVRVRRPVSLRGTSVGLDVHALSVVAHAVDEVTGEVSRARLCPDHGEIFC